MFYVVSGISSGVVVIPNFTDVCFQFTINNTEVLPEEATIIWFDYLPFWNSEYNGDSLKIFGGNVSDTFENSSTLSQHSH